MKDQEETHFGYQTVPIKEKAERVASVFRSVAPKYDVMNDVMSFGLHRLWKSYAVKLAHLQPGYTVLDLAGGTGDMALRMAQKVGDQGQIMLTDINQAMLQVGRDRLLDHGLYKNIHFVQADAETLPFADGHFDVITMAFGLRNVTQKSKALQAMHRVLKPGGQVLILEFSSPNLPGLKPLYDAYSFSLLPKLGEMIAGDRASYQYLAESIRKHPNQENLSQMMTTAGFEQVSHLNLCGGYRSNP